MVDVSSGAPLGPNENGEICVRGPQVMLGYLNQPQATADMIQPDGWLHTGDIGYIDDDGYFFPTSEALHQQHPKLGEVEKEMRAQIERARRSGLKIDYVDYHMGTAVRYPEFRELTERLAREYGLGMSQYFGETRGDPQYGAAPAAKTDSLVALIDRLHPRFNLVVTHVGIDNEELGALLDMNTDGGLAEMSKNRQGELDALMSPRFSEALKARNVRLITYRQLIEMQGLKSMRRPLS